MPGSVVSGIFGNMAADTQADAAEEAARLQAEGVQAGIAEQRRQFDYTTGILKPYQQTGYAALDAMSDLMGLPARGGRAGGPTDFGEGGGAASASAPTKTLRDFKRELRGQYTTGTANRTRFRRSGMSYEEAQNAWQQHIGRDDAVDRRYGDFQSYWRAGAPTAKTVRVPKIDRKGLNAAAEAAYQNYLANLGGAGTGGTGGAGGSGRTPYEFQASPAYEFRLNEGLRALNRAAGRMGGRLSGSRLLGLQEYGQQSASQEFGNQYNRLAGLAGFGRGATSVAAGASGTTGANISNLLSQQGSALGAGALGAGQASAAGTLNLGRSIAGGIRNFGGFGSFGGGSSGGRAQKLDQAYSPGGYLYQG